MEKCDKTKSKISKAIVGKCAKQETIAIIENNGQYWVGTNLCADAQTECPRKDMKTGEGYHLCREICKQESHAEVDACRRAGTNARGSTLYLLGHTYCCDNCKQVMDFFGVKKVVIGTLPDSMLSKIVKGESS